MSFASAASLAGFVGTIKAGTSWLYLVGFAFSVIGHVRLAPSRANIERDQEQLSRDGFDVNLLAALMGQDKSPTTQ